MVMISANELSLEKSGNSILKDIQLSFRGGQCFAIIGPNGAGKTSLLKLLSGEWTPTQGIVRFHDRPLENWDTRELAQHRAFLHQETILEFAFSVQEVVTLGRAPHVQNSHSPQDHEIVREALRRLDLEGMEDRPFPSLSGGEKQRVHLARSLAQIIGTGPYGRFLFLDEPTNNLDLAHQFKILEIVRQLRSEGIGILMILHDLNLAMQYADEIVVLDKGHCVAHGRTDEVLLSPVIEEVFQVSIKPIYESPGEKPYLVVRM